MKKVKKHLWITEEQDEKLRRHRRDLGLTNGELFRRSIDRDFIYLAPFKNLIKSINKIGGHTNQIAHWCNQNEELDEQVLEELRRVNDSLNTIIRTMKAKNDNQAIPK